MEYRDYQLVAAIDFGTTYTGYAYSTRYEFQKDPLKINLMMLNAESTRLSSQKAPTCVLFKPDETFHSFGYEAEDNFNELYMDGDHKDWFFFRRFKMDLYKANVKRTQVLKTLDGKKMSAMKVISAVIAYLKSHLLIKINDRAIDISESEIRWVLTVPAIWSDSAKQMMREAAEKAKIPRDQLLIVLEPEAASILCKHLSAVQLLSIDSTKRDETFQSGSRYLVLDAGGGTIDITVHEVVKGGLLKEIHAANGGDWGGTKIDDAFEDFVETVVGKPAYKDFRVHKMPSLIELHRSFEERKKTFTDNSAGKKITFRIPFEIIESFKKYNQDRNIADVIATKFNPADVDWTHDKIRLSQAKTRNLFELSLHHITDHVSDILKNPEVQDCKAILMVGGYSECPLLQDAIRNVAGNIRVIVPSDAGLSVLKGAVINGFFPDAVSHRICRYTYGTECNKRFEKDLHREDYRVTNERGAFECEHFFDKFIAKGTQINIGISSVTKTFSVTSSNQTAMCFRIFASTSAATMYVTDGNVQKIGQMILDTPDTSLGLERGASVTMHFGGSEIVIEAVDKHTGNSIRSGVDFLG
ncbi:heat shock 70 kDa protein 12A-like [Pecten maximus]|uniref:heat shock 70 kDa protein 12A-like n=1 Tax=Pecten maximus TaxID=6579 RepID=UPI001458804C|nr:heat shock 70 kDa protein 12A-like [Pecten maximus]